MNQDNEREFEKFHAQEFGWEITRLEHYQDLRVAERFKIWKAARANLAVVDEEELVKVLRPYLHFGTKGWRHVAEQAVKALRPYLRGKGE